MDKIIKCWAFKWVDVTGDVHYMTADGKWHGSLLTCGFWKTKKDAMTKWKWLHSEFNTERNKYDVFARYDYMPVKIEIRETK